jgi:hypothetical protein
VVIAKDRFLAISAVKEMISGAGELDAGFPGMNAAILLSTPPRRPPKTVEIHRSTSSDVLATRRLYAVEFGWGLVLSKVPVLARCVWLAKLPELQSHLRGNQPMRERNHSGRYGVENCSFVFASRLREPEGFTV